MLIRDTLEHPPTPDSLANGGQARIEAREDESALKTLRSELSTFVCDGEYADAIEVILRNYLQRLDQPKQEAVWVSGYFGSGKSHLLKMLGHLWSNTRFGDGVHARDLVPRLPAPIAELLRELDTQAKRLGRGRRHLAGSMLGGTREAVRLDVLGLVYQAVGLPAQHQLADFVMWLGEQGVLPSVTAAVAEAGEDWHEEVSNLYVSDVLADAVHAAMPKLADSPAAVTAQLTARFPAPAGDLGAAEFLRSFRRALVHGSDSKTDDLPLTVLVLDEVQQYIGDDQDRASVFTDAVEDVQTHLDSRVALIASGQASLAGTPRLQKLLGRFRTGVQLSEADVQAVTRQVLLAKTNGGAAAVEKLLGDHAGEVSRHLAGSRLAASGHADGDAAVLDFPLLPTRRRFWEACFTGIDTTGDNSQLRSQLRIVHDSLVKIADQTLGAVIPADALFEHVRPLMSSTRVLGRDTETRIGNLENDGPDGPLKKSLAATIFLIDRLPRRGETDLGVRADARTLADLLVPRIDGDSAAFRAKVEQLLTGMADARVLMKTGDEYRLQTPEGAAWEQDLAERLGALKSSGQEVSRLRRDRLQRMVSDSLAEARVLHGKSKTVRKLVPTFGEGDLLDDPRHLPVRVTDGWDHTRAAAEAAAREAGQEGSTIFLFIPQPNEASALADAIAEAEAARRTLDARPSSADGDEASQQAREAMKSRRDAAERKRDQLLREAVDQAVVLLGGGSSANGVHLPSRLEDAATSARSRRFPRFDEADSAAWGTALKRLQEGGGEDALAPVGHTGKADEHPAVQEIVRGLTGPTKGSSIRADFSAAPYGWPQDAIDACLLAAVSAGLARATRDGRTLQARDLKGTDLPRTEFRPESVQVTTTHRLPVRGLVKKLGLTSAGPNREQDDAPRVLRELEDRRRRAGDPAPYPDAPDGELLADLMALTGPEQLVGLAGRQKELVELLELCETRIALRNDRQRRWSDLVRLVEHAAALPAHQALAAEVEAIHDSRSLLAEADPTAGPRRAAVAALRDALAAHHEQATRRHQEELAALEADPSWAALTPEQRAPLEAGLAAPIEPRRSTEEDVLASLAADSLAQRATANDALPGRFARAREAAALALTPQAKPYPLSRRTLETEADLAAWLTEQDTALRAALQEGPVILT